MPISEPSLSAKSTAIVYESRKSNHQHNDLIHLMPKGKTSNRAPLEHEHPPVGDVLF